MSLLAFHFVVVQVQSDRFQFDVLIISGERIVPCTGTRLLEPTKTAMAGTVSSQTVLYALLDCESVMSISQWRSFS